MVLNHGKYHYLIWNKDTIDKFIKLGKKTFHAEAEQKLLGKIIVNDLKFQNHTNSIFKTANQNISVLIRIVSFMTDLNNKVMFNSLLKVRSIILPHAPCLVLEL